MSVKEQKFDIHKCTIAEVKIVTNIRSFLEKARAIAHLQSTPLLPFIINPSMAFRQRLPLMQNYLKKDELVYQNRLDNQQLIAVAKVMRSYTTKQPEICIIEGTAGTGKTDVLVNIIFQLFFSLTTDEERANFRILVCTSSDAEIDAILNRVSKGIEELQMEKDGEGIFFFSFKDKFIFFFHFEKKEGEKKKRSILQRLLRKKFCC